VATQNRTAQADGEMKNDTALKILISLSFPAALSQSIQQARKGEKGETDPPKRSATAVARKNLKKSPKFRKRQREKGSD